jgi:hypothetical protein
LGYVSPPRLEHTFFHSTYIIRSDRSSKEGEEANLKAYLPWLEKPLAFSFLSWHFEAINAALSTLVASIAQKQAFSEM